MIGKQMSAKRVHLSKSGLPRRDAQAGVSPRDPEGTLEVGEAKPWVGVQRANVLRFKGK